MQIPTVAPQAATNIATYGPPAIAGPLPMFSGAPLNNYADLSLLGSDNPYQGQYNAAIVTVDPWKRGNDDCLEHILRQQGFSLHDIWTKKNGRSLVDLVAKANGLRDPNLVRDGQKLIVPTRLPQLNAIPERNAAPGSAAGVLPDGEYSQSFGWPGANGQRYGWPGNESGWPPSGPGYEWPGGPQYGPGGPQYGPGGPQYGPGGQFAWPGGPQFAWPGTQYGWPGAQYGWPGYATPGSEGAGSQGSQPTLANLAGALGTAAGVINPMRPSNVYREPPRWSAGELPPPEGELLPLEGRPVLQLPPPRPAALGRTEPLRLAAPGDDAAAVEAGVAGRLSGPSDPYAAFGELQNVIGANGNGSLFTATSTPQADLANLQSLGELTNRANAELTDCLNAFVAQNPQVAGPMQARFNQNLQSFLEANPGYDLQTGFAAPRLMARTVEDLATGDHPLLPPDLGQQAARYGGMLDMTMQAEADRALKYNLAQPNVPRQFVDGSPFNPMTAAAPSKESTLDAFGRYVKEHPEAGAEFGQRMDAAEAKFAAEHPGVTASRLQQDCWAADTFRQMADEGLVSRDVGTHAQAWGDALRGTNAGATTSGAAVTGNTGAAVTGNNGAAVTGNTGTGVTVNNGTGVTSNNGTGVTGNNGTGVTVNNGTTGSNLPATNEPSGGTLVPTETPGPGTNLVVQGEPTLQPFAGPSAATRLAVGASRVLAVGGAVGGVFQTAGGVGELRNGQTLDGVADTAGGTLNVVGSTALLAPAAVGTIGTAAAGTAATVVAPIALGGAAILDGGRDMIHGINEGNTEKTAVGGVKALGGTLMVGSGAAALTGVGAPVAVGMFVVGGALYLGGTAYEYRHTIANWASSAWNWATGGDDHNQSATPAPAAPTPASNPPESADSWPSYAAPTI